MGGAQPVFRVHGAFELRRLSRTSWPILDFALAEGSEGGLAMYPDRATSGVFTDNPLTLGIVLAYGGLCLYAPNEVQLLSGAMTFRLALYPYEGTAEAAGIAQMAEAAFPDQFIEDSPLLNLLHRPGGKVLRLEAAHAAALSTRYAESGDVMARLWRPYEGRAEVAVDFPDEREVWRADLAGSPDCKLADRSRAVVSLGSHQVLTLRAKGAAPRK